MRPACPAGNLGQIIEFRPAIAGATAAAFFEVGRSYFLIEIFFFTCLFGNQSELDTPKFNE